MRRIDEKLKYAYSHAKILDIPADLHKVCIITDNVRTGAQTILDINAGEDIIRLLPSSFSALFFSPSLYPKLSCAIGLCVVEEATCQS
jgi:hypothetical protein